ncbi:MAG: IS1634 family transposase [Bacteroidetes bacterium]|nr:MAG: IS1634 family transposase [Bacteroidota bacterium]
MHHRKTYYKLAPSWLNLKESIESKVILFAKQCYDFNYDILFYDVTTLYFETFEEDELRRNVFSKDSKSQQPQILIALMVSREGFPISYEVFAGNTFEGHTIVPVINNFIKNNKVKEFTVVADAAMISSENIKQLVDNQINYIVGARLGNLSPNMLDTIDKELIREDGKSIRLKTENGELICSYSSVRYRKDLYEMNKQIEKAMQVIEKFTIFLHPLKMDIFFCNPINHLLKVYVFLFVQHHSNICFCLAKQNKRLIDHCIFVCGGRFQFCLHQWYNTNFRWLWLRVNVSKRQF